MSDFEAIERIIAFPVSIVATLGQLRASTGATLPDGSRSLLTIVGHKDREGSDELRAGQFGISVIPTTLADGRLAVRGYWSKTALAYMQEQKENSNPAFSKVEELTEPQFNALIPESAQ